MTGPPQGGTRDAVLTLHLPFVLSECIMGPPHRQHSATTIRPKSDRAMEGPGRHHTPPHLHPWHQFSHSHLPPVRKESQCFSFSIRRAVGTHLSAYLHQLNNVFSKCLVWWSIQQSQVLRGAWRPRADPHLPVGTQHMGTLVSGESCFSQHFPL